MLFATTIGVARALLASCSARSPLCCRGARSPNSGPVEIFSWRAFAGNVVDPVLGITVAGWS